MNEYKQVIIDYEQSRQLVAKLTKQRFDLINECPNQNLEGSGEICLSLAYKESLQLCRENNEYYEYEEVLSEGHAEGIYCDSCIESYRIKKGSLKTARIEFGKSKRKLSNMGKNLIKPL